MDREQEKRLNDNLMELFEKHNREVQKSYDKFSPILRRLTDMEFAGLWKAVLEERQSRMTRLIIENPLVRRQVLDDLKKDLEAERN